MSKSPSIPEQFQLIPVEEPGFPLARFRQQRDEAHPGDGGDALSGGTGDGAVEITLTHETSSL
ncbi:hypothetical protein [Planctomicrobium sp. SH527]|uniref:hypothetical protein n=1 Tax=Planctomicrobium sp. SH527 TaxID=3448123 RepID=UPI003F5B1FBB